MKITVKDTTVTVESPYNSGFVADARKLGGKWNAPCWVFDVRDEKVVREACLKHYGTDGVVNDMVDVKVTIPEDCSEVGGARGPIELFGRTLARAFGRDSGAKLGDGVVLLEGNFSSGGSMKNWTTTCKDGTTVLLRDVSRKLVETHDNDAFIVEILETETVDKKALQEEKERLISRLTEIDKLLEGDV